MTEEEFKDLVADWEDRVQRFQKRLAEEYDALVDEFKTKHILTPIEFERIDKAVDDNAGS